MARYKKGESGNKNGRPKGVPNKTTTELKETINKIVSITLDNYLEDIEKIRIEDPKKALELSKGLIDYIMPKMTKMELSGDINHKVEKLTIEIKKGTVDGTNN
jgi:uncharacterized protein YeeX (DUF496 family)